MKVRRFTNTYGFQDNTDYLEYNPTTKIMYLVFKHGDKRETTFWTLKQCEENVKMGVWKELPVE